MKFWSVEEIQGVLESGTDLYFVESEVYAFIYSDRGSIAYYYLTEEDLRELATKVSSDDYIGAALGSGGYIVDPNIILPNGEIIEYDDPRYDEVEYNTEVEYDYTPIYDFLRQFVGEECIDAAPTALI